MKKKPFDYNELRTGIIGKGMSYASLLQMKSDTLIMKK